MIEERGQYPATRFGLFPHFCTANSGTKSNECYLGLLYAMEDVAVYGYITPLKVKIVLALALSDGVVRDVEIATVTFYLLCVPLMIFILVRRFSRLSTWRSIHQSQILS